MADKQYGLILPGSKKPPGPPTSAPASRGNVFGEDSDDDDEVPEWMKSRTQKKETQKTASMQQKQAKEVIKKALAEDPSVYQYDELYDDMEQKKADALVSAKKGPAKPKYIHNLLKAAERRQVENEQRMERQVQKEREQEGDEFADKEAFVTSAYRKKIEENEKLLQEERKKDMIDEMQDVTKQQDLGGFYRNLYKTSVAPSEKEIKQEPEEKETPAPEGSGSREKSDSPEELDRREDRDSRKRSSRSRSPGSPSERTRKPRRRSKSRSTTPSLSPERRKNKRRRHSRSRSGSRSPSPAGERRRGQDRVRDGGERGSSKYRKNKGESRKRERQTSRSLSPAKVNIEATKQLEEEKVTMSSIWIKRTVGEIFEDALEKYLRRKAMNEVRPAIAVKTAD